HLPCLAHHHQLPCLGITSACPDSRSLTAVPGVALHRAWLTSINCSN
ncbi:hypothetical protein RRG08_021214, partial [Elysia crispata]